MSTKRKRLVVGALALLFMVVLWSGYCLWRAANAGTSARSELVAAEKSLQARDIPGARQHLAEANASLDSIDSHLGRLGPLRPVFRVTPLVRVQLRGIEAYVNAGRELTQGAAKLTEALDGVLHPKVPNASIADTLEPLRAFDVALRDGITSLDQAVDKIATLNGYRLLGPLDGARRELARRLPDARQKAIDGERGVSALLNVMGGDGPKRYLVLAQNPDEVRPTGGYLGSYGLLETDGAKVHLDRFEGSENWTLAHPDVVLPANEEAMPFRILKSNDPQRLSNTNATVDWPTGARQAQRLWAQGGEAPVDGVLLITPDLLARVLTVLGPVQVPEYGETVTADNLLQRLDFWTHDAAANPQPQGRKQFLSALAQPVMQMMLHAPSSKWVDLGQALVNAMDAREGMAWSQDAKVNDVLVQREWDGQLPDVSGDFFTNADFEYAAKNGRGLTRSFTHVVQANPDGSGTVETTMTLTNTLPFDPAGKRNEGAAIYTVLYGPYGATFDASGSDAPAVTDEAPVNGHPGEGYILRAPPLGSATVKIKWTVPQLFVKGDDGTWRYSLLWRHVATNSADALRLDVRLPDGWKWKNDAPRADTQLNVDVDNVWILESSPTKG